MVALEFAGMTYGNALVTGIDRMEERAGCSKPPLGEKGFTDATFDGEAIPNDIGDIPYTESADNIQIEQHPLQYVHSEWIETTLISFARQTGFVGFSIVTNSTTPESVSLTLAQRRSRRS